MKVFLCHTPYHVLLSGILADDEESVVVVAVEDSYGTSILARELISQKETWVCEVVPGSAGETTFGSHIIAAENVRRIDRILAKYSVTSVITFNYSRPEDQYAASRIASKPLLVEDGLGAYLYNDEPDGLLTNMCQKILYWSGYRPTQELMPVSGCWKLASFFPAYVAGGSRFRPIKLSQSAFRRLCSGKVGEALLRAVAGAEVCESLKHGSDSVNVVALPLWVQDVSVIDEIMTNQEDSMAEGNDRSRHTIVKAHPRASIDIQARPRVSTVPSAVPLELLLGQARDRVNCVLAGLSTVLYTSKILLGDEPPVRCLLRNSVNLSSRVCEFMKHLRIKCDSRWL